jgi:hypothetical protein
VRSLKFSLYSSMVIAVTKLWLSLWARKNTRVSSSSNSVSSSSKVSPNPPVKLNSIWTVVSVLNAAGISSYKLVEKLRNFGVSSPTRLFIKFFGDLTSEFDLRLWSNLSFCCETWFSDVILVDLWAASFAWREEENSFCAIAGD